MLCRWMKFQNVIFMWDLWERFAIRLKLDGNLAVFKSFAWAITFYGKRIDYMKHIASPPPPTHPCCILPEVLHFFIFDTAFFLHLKCMLFFTELFLSKTSEVWQTCDSFLVDTLPTYSLHHAQDKHHMKLCFTKLFGPQAYFAKLYSRVQHRTNLNVIPQHKIFSYTIKI